MVAHHCVFFDAVKLSAVQCVLCAALCLLTFFFKNVFPTKSVCDCFTNNSGFLAICFVLNRSYNLENKITFYSVICLCL